MKSIKEIIIIGTGGVAAEISSYLEALNKEGNIIYKIKGFIDDSYDNFLLNSKRYEFNSPYLGTNDEFEFTSKDLFVFGFANINSRLKLLDKLKEKNVEFVTLIHPAAQVAKTAKIGKGNLINPFCVIGPNAVIGENNILTSYSFISHDCIIGNNNFFSTSGLSGNVIVGNNNFFGIRVTVIPSVSIGNFNAIQAGMTIDKNISDHETVFYKYKEKVTIIKNNK